jgi:membrane protease YdiL (CAAX protease family)
MEQIASHMQQYAPGIPELPKKMGVGGKIWWVIYPFLMFLGVQIMIALIGVFTMLIVAGIHSASNPAASFDVSTDSVAMDITNYATSIVSGAILLFLGIMFMKRDCNTHGLVRDKSQESSVFSWIAVVLAAVGFCLFGNTRIELTSIMDYFWFSQMLNEMLMDMSTGYLIVATVIVAPFTEEIFCRGLIFKRLRSFMGFLPSALISGAIFGVMHLNVVQCLYAVLGGVIFAYIYEKKQSLSATIVAHMAANAASIALGLFAPDELGVGMNLLIFTIVSGIVCAVSIVLLKLAFKQSPAWQVKAIS